MIHIKRKKRTNLSHYFLLFSKNALKCQCARLYKTLPTEPQNNEMRAVELRWLSFSNLNFRLTIRVFPFYRRGFIQATVSKDHGQSTYLESISTLNI